MAILCNRTQGNFTMISNTIFRDEGLKLSDRGLLCTLISLPDGWEFTLNGMAAILPEGRDAIEASLKRLKRLGYVKCYQGRTEDGRLGKNVLEVFSEPQKEKKNDREIRLSYDREGEEKEREKWHDHSEEKKMTPSYEKSETIENRASYPCPDFPDTGKPDTEIPEAEKSYTGKPDTENPGQYHTYLSKTKESNTDECIYAHTQERKEEKDVRGDYWLSVIDGILQRAHGEVGTAAQ